VAVAVCPIAELEFFYSARSASDREGTFASLRAAFGWVRVHDGAYARAWEVQGELTAVGRHPGAGPVDRVIAATAELFGLTLLHHDRDFAASAG
jgi:predicted nucleic acid-binding protein